jgi:hypothetical protein
MKPKKMKLLEKDIQASILDLLSYHKKVAWAERMNTGAMPSSYTTKSGRTNKRFVRFAFKGCSDIIGQLKTGHFLAVEVKRPGNTATDEQEAFLGRVSKAGGLAVLAYSAEEVQEALERFEGL